MHQKEMSAANKEAWTCRTAAALQKLYGKPAELAEKMVSDPHRHLKRTADLLGEVEGKKIINLLGSNGRKAVPLALLGADVTIVDISEGNMRYALELAECAEVNITYILADVASLDVTDLAGTFDIVLTELGVMHYFVDLQPITELIYKLLKFGGRYVLDEGHPIKKCIKMDDLDTPCLEGDYFSETVVEGPVAYWSALDGYEESDPPKCLLRKWTLGEIITAIAEANLTILKLTETPGYFRHLPGHFTLLARK